MGILKQYHNDFIALIKFSSCNLLFSAFLSTYFLVVVFCFGSGFYPGGVLHKYDSVAYPHVESRSKVVRFLKKGWNWFTGGTSETENEIALPSQDVIQSEALKFYLGTSKDTLCAFDFPSFFKADVFINKMMDIFNSLYAITHCMDDDAYDVIYFRHLYEVSFWISFQEIILLLIM